METEPGDWIVGAMMAASGLIGLLMASRAEDDAIYLFGLSLAGFAVVFIFGLMRAHFDRRAPIAPDRGQGDLDHV